MKVRFALLVFLLAWCGQLRAQHVFRSLEEVWAYAEQHNVQVVTTGAQRQVAAGAVRQAYGNLLPSISLNGAFTDNVTIQPTLVPAELFGGEPGVYVEEKFGKRYNYTAGLNAQLDLINPSNWYTVRGARYNEVISESQWKISKQEVYQLSAQVYFTYHLMHEAEALAQESLAASNETLKHTAHLFALGQVSEVTLNLATIQVKAAALTLHVARSNGQTALNQLKQLLELPLDDSLNLPADTVARQNIEDLSLEPSSAMAVKLAYAQMATARNTVQSSRSAFSPVLSAVYAFNAQVTGNDFMTFGNTNSLPQQYWGLRLSIPIMAHHTRSYQLDRSKIDFESKQRQYESILSNTAIDDVNLVNDFTQAYTALAGAKEILELYHLNDSHAAHRLDAGQISVDERLEVYQDYITYRNQYLQYLSDYFIRYAQVQVRLKTF
ncbi:TolC family protein [Chryseolinea lacunae]|uniref:TolC family protein n=1 Tax=Chryseolinea lacunae TaxID=2801331 RepID=A0ABS1L372_9BACT|nr:TolC family protein [Chryseolinea lacunae]MBL0745888.1 TolC family protein [Chryseolinea lacunae]